MSDAPDALRPSAPTHEKLEQDFAGQNKNRVQNPEADADANASALGLTDSHILSKLDPDPNPNSNPNGAGGKKALVHRAKAGEEEEEEEEAETGAGNVSDLGWAQSEDIAERIVGGLSNEDLFLLVRRFNKQVYNVKAVADVPVQRLDLNRAEDDYFSPDKLRATLERFYTTVVIGLTSVAKHIAWLRSWRERRRTLIFCAVYFTAWILDLLAPVYLATATVLAVYPPSRDRLFPPAPPALVDTATGGVQKPKAGVLGSHDSMTGAPEHFKGEAAEQEASNLITSVATVAVGSAVGKHDQGTPDDAPPEESVPDAMDMVAKAVDAQAAAGGEIPADAHDKTRQPMRETVLDTANLAMRVVGDVIDAYERFGNALSPTPPFSMITPRVRLGGVLVCGFLVSLVTSSYVLTKMGTFVVGFGFFGDPIFRRVVGYLDRQYPGWKKFSQLQNSLLKGIPTNAQLTLTLLRIGEANLAPLPPPPSAPIGKRPPSRPASIHHDKLTLGPTPEEIDRAAAADPKTYTTGQAQPTEKPKKTFGSRVIGVFRGTAATGIESKLAVDSALAQVGSTTARNRRGVLRRKGPDISPAGPVNFDARYKGKRGNVVIDSSQKPPLVYFTTDSAVSLGDYKLASRKKGSVFFSLPVTDIKEMRKIGGMGWKGKLITGWAVNSKEVVDGIVIGGGQPQESYRLTAMSHRNELFNRLVAIDGQVWESF